MSAPKEEVIFDIVECGMCGEVFRAGTDVQEVPAEEFALLAKAAHERHWDMIQAKRPHLKRCPAKADSFEVYTG